MFFRDFQFWFFCSNWISDTGKDKKFTKYLMSLLLDWCNFFILSKFFVFLFLFNFCDFSLFFLFFLFFLYFYFYFSFVFCFFFFFVVILLEYLTGKDKKLIEFVIRLIKFYKRLNEVFFCYLFNFLYFYIYLIYLIFVIFKIFFC